MNRIPLYLLIVVLATTIFFGIHLSLEQRRALRWPIADGRIMVLRFNRYFAPTRGGTSSYYAPTVGYKYVIRGITHYGHRVTLFGDSNTPTYAMPDDKIARRDLGLPQADEVKVHYNPQNPTDSYLVAKATGFPIFFSVLPATPLLICFVLLLARVRNSQGVWATINVLFMRRPQLSRGLTVLLGVYPLLCIGIFGLGIAGTPVAVALMIHYALLICLRPFARFALKPPTRVPTT